MYPDSPYADAIGSFQWPVALPEDDPQAAPTVCVEINTGWLPYIAGALKQLLLQSTWNTTDSDALNLVQQRAFSLIALFNEATAEACLIEPTFQQSDDCVLQVSFDSGGTWATIFDATACVAAGVAAGIQNAIDTGKVGAPNEQPGGGSGTPTICYDYDFEFMANSSWIAPIAVEAGDVITLSNVRGAWSDGSGSFPTIDLSAWNCPDGSAYHLGACDPGGATNGADPLPSVDHMRLIANIATIWYDAFDAELTVPPATALGNFILQANDSVLNDNTGSVSGHVQICKGEWCHTFDFTANDGGFSQSPAETGRGTWTNGVGWETTATIPGGYVGVYIHKALSSIAIISVSMVFDATAGTINNGYILSDGMQLNGGAIQSEALQVGTDRIFTLTQNVTLTDVRIFVGVAGDAVSFPDGYAAIKSLTLCGVGDNPF